MDAPRTLHDFRGFPRQLFDIQYLAPGDPVLAECARDLLASKEVVLDKSWVWTTAPGEYGCIGMLTAVVSPQDLSGHPWTVGLGPALPLPAWTTNH